MTDSPNPGNPGNPGPGRVVQPGLVASLLRSAWVQSLRRRILGARPVVAPPVPQALEDAPLQVLASKIVFSHLRNRQQLLGPPPTALGHLDQTETELLIRAAVAAAHANGRFTEDRERLLRGALSANGLHATEPGFLTAALRSRVSIEALLDQVASPHIGSLFYAASLLALDKHDPVNRAYLAFVAARLGLAPETMARLHSQYGIEDAHTG